MSVRACDAYAVSIIMSNVFHAHAHTHTHVCTYTTCTNYIPSQQCTPFLSPHPRKETAHPCHCQYFQKSVKNQDQAANQHSKRLTRYSHVNGVKY